MPWNLVVGSINFDFTIKIRRFPEEGETITGGVFFSSPGGKGLNQAIASARAGMKTYLLGCVGDDPFSQKIKESVADEENLKLKAIVKKNTSTGCAFIIVDDKGKNRIVVSPGANLLLSPDDVERTIQDIEEVSSLVVQCELTKDTVKTALETAKKRGITSFLNTAPFKDWVKDICHLADFIILNEKEAKMLVEEEKEEMGTDEGKKSETKTSWDSGEIVQWGLSAVRRIRVVYGSDVILTLGGNGVIFHGDFTEHFPAFQVNSPVDTTGAGDTFIGYFTAEFIRTGDIRNAIHVAQGASALCVSRKGAVSSIPTLSEVHTYISSHKQ